MSWVRPWRTIGWSSIRRTSARLCWGAGSNCGIITCLLFAGPGGEAGTKRSSSVPAGLNPQRTADHLGAIAHDLQAHALRPGRSIEAGAIVFHAQHGLFPATRQPDVDGARTGMFEGVIGCFPGDVIQMGGDVVFA